MNLMDSASASFELDNKPLVRRYVLGVGAVCFGFWFFDYVMRGWFGGEPNLGVSLRHTFIIAICLVFVVGFLLRQSAQMVALSADGLDVISSDGRQVHIKWSEIKEVEFHAKQIVICAANGRRVPIRIDIALNNGFIETLEQLAGPGNELTIAVKKLLSR